eukprot:scaffold2224_cov74-Skeletonema_dohrnii-CCMP3373.AAC.1
MTLQSEQLFVLLLHLFNRPCRSTLHLHHALKPTLFHHNPQISDVAIAKQRLQIDDDMKKHQIMHTFIDKTATNKLMTSKV